MIDERPQQPLIGREAELAELRAGLGLPPGAADAAADAEEPRQPGTVIVAGDAGVGKSRLLSELAAQVKVAGGEALVGHCLDLSDATSPYLPFAEMLGRWIREHPERAADLQARYPALAALTGQAASAAAAGADVRDQLVAVITELSEPGERGDPATVVLIEDAHWADRSTRDVIGLLMSRGSRQARLVISYRADDVHRRHPLRAALAEWSRLPGVHRLGLNPLPDKAIVELVGKLHPASFQPSVLDRIVERAAGNAFFAEELVGAAGDGSTELPDDLAALLLVRLDRLDDNGRRVAVGVAIGGHGVRHEVLSAAVGLDETALEQALRSAVEHHLLVPVGAGYGFRHALLAEAVLDDVLPGERRRWHQAFHDALLGMSAETVGTTYWAELARHARAAGRPAAAVQAGLRAADMACELGGPDEAARQYRTVLASLQEHPELAAELDPRDADRVAITGDLIAALSTGGDVLAAIGTAKDLVTEVSQAGNQRDKLRAMTQLAEAALAEDSWLSFVTARDALAEAPADLPDSLRARLLSVLARSLMGSGKYAEARRRAEQALEVAERIGLGAVAGDAATTLARLNDFEGVSGAVEDAEREFTAIMTKARRDNRQGTELRAGHHFAGVYAQRGDWRRAQQLHQRTAERALELGRPFGPWGLDSRVLAANGSFQLGDWDAALQLAQVPGQAPPAAAAALEVIRLTVAAARGGGEQLARSALARNPGLPDGMVVVMTGFAAIDALGDAGDLPAATAGHDAVVAQLTEAWGTPYFPGRVRLAALLIGQQARHVPALPRREWAAHLERARQLADDAARAAAFDPAAARTTSVLNPTPTRGGLFWGPEGQAWSARVTAELLRLRWQLEPGTVTSAALTSAWETTVALFDALPYPFEQARARARWAQALAAAGDEAKARDLRDAAHAVALELSAAPLLAELRRLPVSGGPTRRRRARSAEPAAAKAASSAATTTGPGRNPDESGALGADLTAREREVLALLALGRSNGEIGKSLFISTKTASVHVSNILAKLGATGRTEAAALAREHQLV
ncbi:AAA family ATPase [Nakamurella aerolata]|uniref:AAA family ATPase n=1 Tax=Nakamurella aerolata TaxID=1656892 RepID=A0A849A723_9ACTN|nr:AAA family ATPase [Nakamurella aerolata]